MVILTTGGVDVPATAAKTRSLYNALDAILIIFHQQCSDVGQDIVELICVECCVELFEFAHTSACVCSRAFVQVMRTIASRSVSLVVGGARAGDGSLRLVSFNITRLARCACSRHVACNMVGSASIDDGWSGQNPTTEVKEHFHLSRSFSHPFFW